MRAASRTRLSISSLSALASLSPKARFSSPAIRRNKVDFPHPDGPTKTTNSPWAMSRSTSRIVFTSPNDFETFFSTTSATEAPPLSLHRPGGKAGDDATLEDEHQQDERHGHDDGRRHDAPPRKLETRGAADERDRHRDRPALVREREGDREQELVPRADEREQPGGGERGPEQRHEYAGDDGERFRPVHQRGLLQLLRQLAHEGGQHPGGERQGEDHVREREAPEGVVDAQPGHQLEHAREDRSEE